MIRTDLLISSPIFLIGLVHTLTNAGIKVVATRLSPDEEPSWLADTILIDVDAVSPPSRLAHIAATAEFAAVLVLNDAADGEGEAYLDAGATGVISKRKPGDQVVEAVRAVTSGTCVPAAAELVPDQSASPDRGEQSEPGYHLSKREEQVLRQISCGLTHGQIATRLGISPHTVDTYVKRIRAKLGVGNKAELTRAALLGSWSNA